MTKEKGPGVAVVVAALSADKTSMEIKTVEVEKIANAGAEQLPEEDQLAVEANRDTMAMNKATASQGSPDNPSCQCGESCRRVCTRRPRGYSWPSCS